MKNFLDTFRKKEENYISESEVQRYVLSLLLKFFDNPASLHETSKKITKAFI
jgi:hypothetical protein